ncbi:FAD binding domain protein [Metarhizium robertsii]|uniref:Aromatic-ring hydroxylase-like protein n=2 Tax=Metarhizium robertsii TaxID=568076 RepID=E9EQB9_METRA|nr:Aromatic-ring hydroxylase-like protein [Metarhizium robertsii ARSEF 23]EFZ02794.2 Aromatic-ring hydroxylase-like protein [Metarhizium robertsii ARSEF 23]EXV06029.1 FAD binding domain protein [Metarhizium robertsii]
MLHVIIVGAGISGLTCAITLAKYTHVQVTVLERAAVMDKAGNGIQVPCNAAHAMRCLGLLDKLLVKTNGPATAFLNLKYDDGEILLHKDLTRCEELYGAPWLLIHRADYMTVLLDEARRVGVRIRLGCDVDSVDLDTPSVKLQNGHVYQADVVESTPPSAPSCTRRHSPSQRANTPTARSSPARNSPPHPSGISSPPPASPAAGWGPSPNAVFYPLQEGTLFNLVIAIADPNFNNNTCDEQALLPSVRAWLSGWDPTLLEMLDAASHLVRFPLYQVAKLPFWSKGCVTLTGDAAHAMPPHLAQGAATGVEDGFILGTLLGRLSRHVSGPTRRAQLRTVLRAYETLQHDRTAQIVSGSRFTGMLDHLPQGPDQRARDAEFAMYDPEKTVSAMPWIDARTNRKLLGRKVDEVAEGEVARLLAAGEFADHGTKL